MSHLGKNKRKRRYYRALSAADRPGTARDQMLVIRERREATPRALELRAKADAYQALRKVKP